MKLKPCIPLDKEVLGIIEKYYKVRDMDQILNRFCFSNPQLENHVCNTLAVEDEGCEFCKNVPENFGCQLTCDISHICHAAYACRLGIGGNDIIKAVKNNSEISYERLLEEVQREMKQHKKDKQEEVRDDVIEEVVEESMVEEIMVVEEETTVEELLEEDLGEEDMSEIKVIDEETCEGETGRPAVPEGEELLTCKQVADILGCTLINIYRKIADGKVAWVGNPRKRRIPASEVERLKATSRTFKKRQAATETVEE